MDGLLNTLLGNAGIAAVQAGNSAVSYVPEVLLSIIVVLFLLLAVLGLYCRNLLNYKKITSVLPIEAGICDETGNILYYSDETAAGYSVMPKSLKELPVELQSEFEKILPEVFQSRIPRSVDVNVFRTCRKIDFCPLPDSLYGYPTVMWLSTNITELHQAYTECAQTAQRFQRTLASIGDAVVVMNYDGEMTLLNRVAESLSGYSRKIVCGKKFDEYFSLLTEDGHSPLMHVIQAAEEYEINTTLRCKDKPDILVEGKITPIVEKDRLVIGAVACFRNVTESIRQKKQLQSALEFAQTADRAKSDFISTLSHEFRGSVNTIIGYTDLIGMDLKEKEHDYPELEKIREEGNDLLKLLDDILDFSKHESAARKIQLAPMNLKDTLREIQRIFIKTSESRKTALLINGLDTELPLFLSDHKIFRQILIRVLSSCFTRTANGEIRLTAEWNDPALRLEIAAGPNNLSGEITQEMELELSITKRLLSQLGGSLKLALSDNKLHAELFFKQIESRPMDAPQDLPSIQNSSPLPHKDVIILVDDISVNLTIHSRMLQILNIPCVCCDSAQAAMKEIEQYIPAAVFTDLWMPVQCGDELARHLHGNPKTARIPVVLITADSEADEKIRTLFDAVLFKPLKINKLKEIVQEVVPSLLNPGQNDEHHA